MDFKAPGVKDHSQAKDSSHSFTVILPEGLQAVSEIVFELQLDI